MEAQNKEQCKTGVRLLLIRKAVEDERHKTGDQCDQHQEEKRAERGEVDDVEEGRVPEKRDEGQADEKRADDVVPGIDDAPDS